MGFRNKRFYVADVKNVLVDGEKETRFRVLDRVTGKTAKGTKGFGGAASTYYTKPQAQSVARTLNNQYPQLPERWR